MSSTMATWTGEWQIVSADLDLSHVFLPNNKISFSPIERKGGWKWFKLAHIGKQPADCTFHDIFLVEVAGHQPHFQTVAKTDRLPLFSKEERERYTAAAESISAYVTQNQEVQHLEGVMPMDCHVSPEQQKENGAAEHPPRSVAMPIHIYQFANAVEGKRPLLVVHTPMWPACLINGNGTVLAYS